MEGCICGLYVNIIYRYTTQYAKREARLPATLVNEYSSSPRFLDTKT